MLTISQSQFGWGRRKPRAFTQPGHLFAGKVLGAWLLNDAGLRVQDWSGLNNPGTASGTLAWVGGPFGGLCLKFDGSTTKVQVADSPTLSPVSFSLIAWVYPTAYQATFTNYIASKETAANLGWSLSVNSTPQLQLLINATALTGTQPPLNQWSQVAATYDGNSKLAAIYLNGLQLATATINTLTTNTVALQIGQNSQDMGAPVPWTGCIDHFLFINGAVSAPTIARLYRDPFALFNPGPLVAKLVPGGIPFSRNSALLRRRRRKVYRLPRRRQRPELVPQGFGPLHAEALIARRRRQRKASRARKRRGRKYDYPRNPGIVCPKFFVLEAEQATLSVKEELAATGLTVERDTATALVIERESATASVQEQLAATAMIVTCH
jgi:hypothetical protein